MFAGGLGFGMKWDMGWMHDTLRYLSNDPIHRQFHHGSLTFRMVYAFHENFVLPLSHDEVVHEKSSLIGKMPGDRWQKFANLRLLFTYMYAQPGKKLLFMGGEFGQWSEWNHEAQLDWELLNHHEHAALLELVKELNRLYRSESGLYRSENRPECFAWLDANNAEENVLSFLRLGASPEDAIVAICNFSGTPRYYHRVGVPEQGQWKEIFNSDATRYGGSGICNRKPIVTRPIPLHGHYHSLTLTLPPLGGILLKLVR